MTSDRSDEERGIGRIVIDHVEYFPPGMLSGPTLSKHDQIYMGAGPRKSDGMHCLGIMQPGGSRRHNIEVGSIVALTLDGERFALETPSRRHNIRAQEITRLVEGEFSEAWAIAYFDPMSPKFFKADPDYEAPNGQGRSFEIGPDAQVVYLNARRHHPLLWAAGAAIVAALLWWFARPI